MMFAGLSRDELREHVPRGLAQVQDAADALRRSTSRWSRSISEHPEYHVIIESAASDLANYSPRSGQLNPWLHMGLHMAIREQVATNRPHGITEIHEQLAARAGDAHEAEHRMLTVLAEALWEAQRAGQAAGRKRLPGAPARPRLRPSADSSADQKCEPVPTSDQATALPGEGPEYTARQLVLGACMGLSETILAAIIGALATMGTAIFQLIRNRAPSEAPSRRKTACARCSRPSR